MSIHKYKDWSGWFDGLRSAAMKAGAEAISTNLGAFISTNAVANAIPAFHDYALGWHVALATTGIQFVTRSLIAAANYVANKPDPQVEEIDTQVITKSDITK